MPYTKKWFLVTAFFIVLPFATNTVLAYSTFEGNPQLFGEDPTRCMATAAVAFGCSLSVLFGFAWHKVGPKKTLFATFYQSVVLIFTFAGLYRGHPVKYDPAHIPDCLLSEYTTSLYFSVVTWTTLGYGDCTPAPDIRLVAAFEALVGNLSFGMAVGLGTYLLCSSYVAGEDAKMLKAFEAMLEKRGL
jgi:Ion channel